MGKPHASAAACEHPEAQAHSHSQTPSSQNPPAVGCVHIRRVPSYLMPRAHGIYLFIILLVSAMYHSVPWVENADLLRIKRDVLHILFRAAGGSRAWEGNSFNSSSKISKRYLLIHSECQLMGKH